MRVQAGRELDAKVAEVVMGWTYRGLHPIHECPLWATGHGDTFLPKFSTEWDGMRLIVERMRELGWLYAACCGYETHRFQFYRPGCRDTVGIGSNCETLPHAVCLAALAAIEGQSKV